MGDSALTEDRSETPVQVNVLTQVVDVTGGESHSLALKSDGTVWVWGGNDYNQIGQGGTSSIPIRMGTLSQVMAIAAGLHHNLVLKADGTVWAWGSNGYGELGDSSTSFSEAVPVRVRGLSDVIAIGAGYYHSVALKRDGTLWAWGANGNGRLGDSTDEWRNTPVQVKILTSVLDLGLRGSHTLAVEADGTIWAFGDNEYGQLGIGTNAIKIAPVLSDTRDDDNDGLTNSLERELGSNPENPDTNGDGILDGSAYNLGISLLNMDMDGDGLSNTFEVIRGTNPFSNDTDGDGVSDFTDAFPLDALRTTFPSSTSGDVTAPTISLTLPTNAILLP